jgi:hypothetical protein
MILKEHCIAHVVVFYYVTAGVTYVSCCGFQGFLKGENLNKDVVN